MPRYVGIAWRDGQFPYANKSRIMSRRFQCDEDALAFAKKEWGKKKLRMIVLRIEPSLWAGVYVVGKVGKGP